MADICFATELVMPDRWTPASEKSSLSCNDPSQTLISEVNHGNDASCRYTLLLICPLLLISDDILYRQSAVDIHMVSTPVLSSKPSFVASQQLNICKQTCANKYVQINICKQTCANKYVQINIYKQTCANKYVQINICKQTCANKYVQINVCKQT